MMYRKKYDKYNSKIDILKNSVLYGGNVQLCDRTVNFDNIEEKMKNCDEISISTLVDILGCYQMTYNTSFWDQISKELGDINIKLLCLSSDVFNEYLNADSKIPEIYKESIKGINVVLSCNSDNLARKMNKQYNFEGRYFIGFEHNVHIINNVIIMVNMYPSWNICDIITQDNWETLDMPKRIQKILDVKLSHLLSNPNSVYLTRKKIIDKLKVLVDHMSAGTTPTNTESTFRFKQDGTAGPVTPFGVDTYIQHQPENWRIEYTEYLKEQEEESRKREAARFAKQQKKLVFLSRKDEIQRILLTELNENFDSSDVAEDSEFMQHHKFMMELSKDNFKELVPGNIDEEKNYETDFESYIYEKFYSLFDKKFSTYFY